MSRCDLSLRFEAFIADLPEANENLCCSRLGRPAHRKQKGRF
jgi:hypothetical protein